MTKDLQLLQTLNARLFHDLASSIGTIGNCISLLGTVNKATQMELKMLILKASDDLVKKFKFFRNVYATSNEENEMSTVYLKKMLIDFFSNSSVEIKFYENGITYLDGSLARALMCVTVIASENINYIGDVSIIFGKDKDDTATNGVKIVKIISNGKSLKLRDRNLHMLGNPINASEITIDNCREYYINILCNQNGYKISADRTAGTINYNLVAPSCTG